MPVPCGDGPRRLLYPQPHLNFDYVRTRGPWGRPVRGRPAAPDDPAGRRARFAVAKILVFTAISFGLYRLPARIVISALSVSRSRVRSLFHRPPHRGHRTTSISPLDNAERHGLSRRRPKADRGGSRALATAEPSTRPPGPNHFRLPGTRYARRHVVPTAALGRRAHSHSGDAHASAQGGNSNHSHTQTQRPDETDETDETPRWRVQRHDASLTRRLVDET